MANLQGVHNELHVRPPAMTSATSTSSVSLTFDDVAKLFTEKANAIVGRRKLAGPGSEYANIAVAQGTGNVKTNPATGLHIYCNNPTGLKCTNTLASGKLLSYNYA
jgi:hypothetical protein